MFNSARYRHVVYAVFFSLFFLGHVALAKPVIPPESLQGWQGWVSYGHEDNDCPHIYNGQERECRWPTSLSIEIKQKAALFTLTVELFADSWVTLPGSLHHWPQTVRAGEQNGGQP